MSKYVAENFRIEDAYIPNGRWRNFSGTVTDMNKTGERKFNIFLPEELAGIMKDIGWYVKYKEPYKEGGDPIHFIEVAVSWKLRAPMIKLISYDGKETNLTEETVGILDSVDIDHATVEINPNNWDVNGRKGCKAYLYELEVHAKPPRRAYNGSLNRDEDDD